MKALDKIKEFLTNFLIDDYKRLEFDYTLRDWFASTPPFSWIHKANWWIRFRTWDKYHIVKTGLRPGYYEKDTILLYSSFNLLVDFVERECAWMSWCCSPIYKAEKPWYYPAGMWVNKNGKRLGLAHLNWEASLINDEGCQRQAKFAKEMKKLYLWWKDYLTNDSAYWNNQATFDKETEMLIRLVKVRSKLWT